MRTKRMFPLAALVVLALSWTSAQAGWHIGIGIGYPPCYRPYHYRVVVAAPVYYVPAAPVYVQPTPVYVQPAPVYVQPTPVYVPPGYVQPAPVYVQPQPGQQPQQNRREVLPPPNPGE
jgi:hypothetical protein